MRSLLPKTPSVRQKPFGGLGPRRRLAVLLVFAAIGSYFIYQSFAATNANLPGDINNDNKVNLSDLSLLLSKWGTNTPTHDINGDGTVSLQDMSILLTNWGKTYTPTTPPPTTPPTAPPPTTPPPTTPPAAVGSKVYRSGKQLMLNGAAFKFVGFNNFGLTGCDSGNVAPSQADLDDYFSRLRPKSVTRTWAFESVNHTAIDNVIKAAEKYDQKLILALGEGAGYCGAPHYRRAFYQSGYKGAYFTWIQNTVSKYKDSPAIIWEIMNEAGQASGPGGVNDVTADGDGMTLAEMKSFYTNTAAQIKKYDPNHLVSSGAISTSRTYHKGEAGYEAIHSSPNIDLVSAHEYHYLLYGLAGLNKFWTDEKAAADALNKPIFAGEFGALPDGCQTSAQRSTIIKGKYDAYLNAGAVGALYFAVGKPGKTGSQCGSIDKGTYNTVDAYTEPLFTMAKGYTNSHLPTPK